MSTKRLDNRAWLLVAPVFLMVAFTTLIPLMTVVNYSVQDILGPNQRFFVGWEWYQDILKNPDFIDAFLRQLGFTFTVLLIEIPLGILLARQIPAKGPFAALALVILALPLLIPFNVVGTIWQIMARSDIGLLGISLEALGISYNYAADPLDAWLTLILVDVWHWLPLVVLLAYSGLRGIPQAYYQAAAIDRASNWDILRHIQLPRLKPVLIIALLLRFMDSFMIYTEPFVITGGGPGNATTFLSQYLASLAVGQFDLGVASAFSLIYFVIIMFVCFLFYTVIIGDQSDHTRRSSE